MSPSLSVIAAGGAAPAHSTAETVAERVRRLQAEARQAARDHSRALIAAVAELEVIAEEIAAAGAPYPAGVVNEARVLAGECAQRVERLTAILGRAP